MVEARLAVPPLADELGVGLRDVGELGLDEARAVGLAEQVVAVVQEPRDLDAVVLGDLQAVGVVVVLGDGPVGMLDPDQPVLAVPGVGRHLAGRLLDRELVALRVVAIGRDAAGVLAGEQAVRRVVDVRRDRSGVGVGLRQAVAGGVVGVLAGVGGEGVGRQGGPAALGQRRPLRQREPRPAPGLLQPNPCRKKI